MKKKYCAIALILLLSAANIILTAKCKHLNIHNNNQSINDEAVTSEDVTVLMANLSRDWYPGIPMEGWFTEHLKEELSIEVWQADYAGGPGWFYACDESGIDLCWFNASEGYYDAVRQGKLRNLEDEIEKWPQIYQKYQNAIAKMKFDTYEHTGKQGVYGIPVWLNCFDATWREGCCLAIPVLSSYPEQAMELINYSATDGGIMNIAFGPEGQMWEKENGRYVLRQDWYDEDPCLEFVKTKEGLEDFYTARCCMELVGNEMLGRELLAMTAVNRRDGL